MTRLLECLFSDYETTPNPKKPPEPMTPANATENEPAKDEQIVNIIHSLCQCFNDVR